MTRKWHRLLTYFKIRYKGIIFLQETYTLPGDLGVWQQERDDPIYMSRGTRHSYHVAILIQKYYNHSIEHIILGNNGQHIMLHGTFKNTRLTLLNYYAPTNDKQQDQFKLFKLIMPYINDYFAGIICRGDMNTTLQLQPDRCRTTDRTTKYSNKIVKSCMNMIC